MMRTRRRHTSASSHRTGISHVDSGACRRFGVFDASLAGTEQVTDDKRSGSTHMGVTLRRLMIALGAVLALWVGFAVTVTAPPDRSDYRRTAVQAAESARDAAGTGALVAQTQLDGDAFGTFVGTAYDDATRTVAGAAKQIAGQPPPDDASAQLRDEVLPLVQEAVHALGDASRATSMATLRAALAALNDVAGKLADIVDKYG
jgi:hypothetical protein